MVVQLIVISLFADLIVYLHRKLNCRFDFLIRISRYPFQLLIQIRILLYIPQIRVYFVYCTLLIFHSQFECASPISLLEMSGSLITDLLLVFNTLLHYFVIQLITAKTRIN
jgi:hypothetical protein